MTAILVLLFVVLPFAVAGLVLGFVSWRTSGDPAPPRTSDILRTGDAADAEILVVRNMGQILDVKPMVRVRLRVTPASAEPFEIEVTQSFARDEMRALQVGRTVPVRVLADRSAAAIARPPRGAGSAAG